MPRIPALRSVTDRKSNNVGSESQAKNVSAALAEAKSSGERREVFTSYLEGNREEFDADCKKVAKLLQRNDVDGLIEHGSRHIPDQAAARVAEIRAGK